MRKFLSLLLAVSAVSPVFAHEGHGHTEGFTITHYFTEAEHAIPLALALVAVIVLIRQLRKMTAKK
jgi:hydrogenase/urease accessory protein HupE